METVICKRTLQTVLLWLLTGYAIGKLESKICDVVIGVEVQQHWSSDGEGSQGLSTTHSGSRCRREAVTPDDVHTVIGTGS